MGVLQRGAVRFNWGVRYYFRMQAATRHPLKFFMPLMAYMACMANMLFRAYFRA